MNRIKGIKRLFLIVFLFGFVAAGTLNACRDTKKEENPEQEMTGEEHPSDDDGEHPKGDDAEHPSGDDAEHPSGDDTKHPEGEGDEHPSGDDEEHPSGGDEHPD